MAVVRARYDWKQRGGRYGAGLDHDEDIPILVIVNSKTDTLSTIKASGAVPAFGAQHPYNPLLKCREVSGQNSAESWKKWECVAHYSASPGTQEQEDSEENPNPLLRPVKLVRIRSVVGDKWITRDIHDTPLGTYGTADGEEAFIEPYEPQRIPSVSWVLSFQRHVSNLPTWIFTDTNPVNSDNLSFQFLGVTRNLAAETCMLQIQDVSEEQYVEIDNGGSTERIDFATITFDLHWKKEGWNLLKENKGFVAIRDGEDGEDDEFYEIMVEDDAGQRVRPEAPQYLDVDGRVMARPVSPNAVVINEFETLPRMAMQSLFD